MWRILHLARWLLFYVCRGGTAARNAVVVVAAALLLWSLVAWRESQPADPEDLGPDSLHGALRRQADQACVHPKLDPSNPDVMKLFHEVPPVNCGPDKDWTHVTEGKFRIAPEARRIHGNITCSITPILFKDDFKFSLGATEVDIQDGDPIESDFSRVECTATSGSRYSIHHAAVASTAELKDRHLNKPLAPDSLGLDVLMFGLDSVSKMTWLRTLPKTREYFVHILGGLELDGYNIVGDGTPAALLPILTGQTEEELPEARRSHRDAKTVDGHPWIWKECEKQGYITMFAEDAPEIGVFHYRMLGFARQPTDHYMRTFYLSAVRHYRRSKKLCIGSIPRYQIFLNWFRHGFSTYKNKRKFMFGFHSEISHGDNNLVQVLDEENLDFLQFLKSSGHLDNAVLILMSDHGARFSVTRATHQGKLEERKPYFGFRFPPWFEDKYPDAMRNFRANLHRLTTPFDIHETLQDILHFRGAGVGNLSSRGISLFQEVPRERTCRHAAVEPHWCACLVWEAVAEADPVVRRVAGSAVAFINKWTESVRDSCAQLSLSQVTKASKYSTRTDVLKFKKSKDFDGRVADLSGTDGADEVLYQVSIVTEPNKGSYEMTLRYSLKTGNATMSTRDVSRTNRYGSDPDCVARNMPHLRPYCYCK